MITKTKSAVLKLWQRAQGEPRRWLHWYVLGTKATPPPDIFKQQLVKRLGRRFGLKTFVETGTYKGDMTAAAAQTFDKVYSIELHLPFYEKAATRFSGNEKVKILHGDSRTILPLLLNEVQEPCLFWLDAHGGQSAKDSGGRDEPAPIMPEVEAILAHPNANAHVVLIDDVHTFVRNVKWGIGVWHQLDQLRARWLEKHPDWVWKIEDNILRIYRKRSNA